MTLATEARADCAQSVGEFVDIHGKVEAQIADGDAWSSATLETALCEGSSIRVGKQSRAAIALANDAVLRLDENTTMRLVDVAESDQDEESSLLDIIKGAFHSFSRKPKKLSVNSPYLNGSIEGTEFVFRVTDEQTEITVFEGTVVAANEQGSVPVTSGESASARAGQAPAKRILVNPRDQVTWGLYYPRILFAGDSSANPAIIEIAGLLESGRVKQAQQKLSPLLSAGESGLAYALSSVINVALNQNEAALADGQRAVELTPSVASSIALSYAQQASLDLESARNTMRMARDSNPDNASVMARLAELELMFGERRRATELAGKAVQIDPELSNSQIVLGFAALSSYDHETAGSAFDKAIALDSANPLAHLGLGLSKISAGNLVAGRRDIEAAVALDSNDSIIRSYLGKAYFEEKRSPLDQQQFEIAQALDPNDPTPWFYGSISHQTEGRPVQALQDQQKAIELNDNRAIYRSRLLLDSDQAARGVSLGQVYNDLGFQQLALAEGWKSVNTDPTNSSAHLFLADSYSALPRHEIARVSEVLQAQLLQPVNAAPVHPAKAEGSLLLATSGPATAGFNEYNALFNRNQTNFLVSGMVGELDTNNAEVIVSGLYGKTAFSAGVYHFETDGFRDGAFQDDDIANLFVQHDFSPDTSVQAELRTRETEYGDIRLKFFERSIYPDKLNTEETDTLRLGARHSFAPGSTILVSLTEQEGSKSEVDEPFPQPGVLFSELDSPDREASGRELQYLFRTPGVNIVAGVGSIDSKEDVVNNATLGPPFIPGPPFSPPSIDVTRDIPADIEHRNAYLYSNLSLISDIILTLGVSYDDIDSEFLNEETTKTNPKLGITWTPNSQTTVRAAAFETVKRTLATQQTLEPTQVAGFNQFYDDYDLTETKRTGIAIDHKFNSNLSGGLEISKRELEVPFVDLTVAPPFPTESTDWEERLDRAYLYWTPSEQWALRAEYMLERLDRDTDAFPDGVVESDTQRIPLGVSYFHSDAWSASLTTTYYDQEGEFGGFWTTDPIEEGEDDFWIIDVAVNYRLPKRQGFVTVGATNLLDEDFSYFETDLNNASIQPARMVFGKLTLTW
jgi:tetratricopeptide (TPR) repeat protein